MGFVDLAHQVMGLLGWRRGGSGNPYGWGTAVVESHTNWSTTDPLPLGTVVRLRNGGAVEPTDTAAETDVLGVVVGYWGGARQDTLVPADCPVAGNAAVMTKGRCGAIITEDVATGEYAFADGSTDGAAYGDAAIDVGAFGVWLASGALANGVLVPVELFGAPVTSAGGGAGLESEAEFLFVTPTNGLSGPPLRVPYDATIVGWTVYGDAVGSVVLDVWKGTTADYIAGSPPDVTDTITASAKPNLSSDLAATSTTLTGWDVDLLEGDVLVANVDTVSGLGRVTLVLHTERA